jgi:hypothetical protein
MVPPEHAGKSEPETVIPHVFSLSLEFSKDKVATQQKAR